ncbi:Uncharacterized protein SCF082_LOCUS4565 [Durusdinium trenchii]|uniref:Uncharacterized protein n=1 Tax=Durusdinium trenchii TaxID=1381693 RepID=A0ABP0I042_9DINO
MRWREVPTASFDIRFHEEGQEGKVSPAMDLLSDAGFELALLTVLNAKMGSFLAVIGLVCRSFVTISSGTHKRTPWRPLGDERVAMVQEGNGLLSRVTLLIMVISAMGGCWLLEQPRTSLILYHPRTRHLWRLLPKVYSASWWMGLYNALTPKRHIAFSNATAVKLLDLGTMSREAMNKLSRHGPCSFIFGERLVLIWETGSKMQLEIEKLKVELEQAKGAPAPKAKAAAAKSKAAAAKSAPAPKSPPAPKSAPAKKVSSEPESQGKPPPETEAAKMARLRRVCERKPSGKLMVPEEVHNRWRTANHDERVAMCDELEAAGWDKETFVKRTKIQTKTNKLTRKKKRGWYTEEQMKTKLGWSKSYIKSVVAYCRRKGNERLIKKDIYNKNLEKFYVVVDENDTDVSEDEEVEQNIKEETVPQLPSSALACHVG